MPQKQINRIFSKIPPKKKNIPKQNPNKYTCTYTPIRASLYPSLRLMILINSSSNTWSHINFTATHVLYPDYIIKRKINVNNIFCLFSELSTSIFYPTYKKKDTCCFPYVAKSRNQPGVQRLRIENLFQHKGYPIQYPKA
jgi:hypothetical protein